MKKQLTVCKACGHGIATSAKSCPQCGAKNKKPVTKKWWFWLLILMFIGLTAGTRDEGTSTETEKNAVPNATVAEVLSIFDGECGIVASAEIGNNIINMPELEITITNTTSKEIAAIQFYAVPYDVYGDEIISWTTQSNLYTDIAIPAGKTTSISYQFIEDTVKTVKLYVYSVYFADGTEWGDKDATTSQILDNAPTIKVEVKS